jgi:2-oxoglutarate ferredoxin oxidoreductase subunit alpha
MDPRNIRRRPDEVRIKIGGAAGLGIKAAGQTLARSFMHAGLWTFDLTEYPSLIKGGHNVYSLRVAGEPLDSHVMPVDILVALDGLTAHEHRDELVEGGAVIFDPMELDAGAVAGDRDDLCLVPVPLSGLVREAGGPAIMRNVCALGAVLGHMDFPLEFLEASLRAQFAHKEPSVAELNAAVAGAGWEHAKEAACHFPFRLEPRPGTPPRILVDGNESIGFGAIAAGIGFYAAYPMTPASSLLTFMAARDQEYGIVVKHPEDEIAAMNMVVGAAFGGSRAMCATSGGGFSLMVEAFGLAGVSESAVVVGLFTRPGPATGMPTWTEQSDLRFALHAAQGEFPRVILAPGDRTQAFEYAWRAFDLADQLQTPVILLGDTYLSDNRATVAPFDTEAVVVDRGKLVTEGDVTDRPAALAEDGVTYLRYKVTDDGVSVRVLPGVRGATQLVNSYEHDEYGYGAAGEIAANRVAQNEKRMRKLEPADDLVPRPVRWRNQSPDAPDVSIVTFGSTVQPIREAMRWLAKDGVVVECLQVTTIWPFPSGTVAAYLHGAPGRTLVIEGNLTGQLEGLVRQECLLGFDERLHRCDGRPFSPEQIWEHVMNLTGREVAADA